MPTSQYTTEVAARLCAHSKPGPNDCIDITYSHNKNGYSQIKIDGIAHLVHRVAYELSYGSIPNGMFVCHRCDNPRCINPNHLFLGTPADNMNDKVNKGREWHPIGELHPAARLTNADVLAIRAACASGETQRSVARRYNMAYKQVNRIVLRKDWKHL